MSSEETLNRMDEANDLIEQARVKLRDAHAKAKDKPEAQAKIEEDLKELTRIQEQLALIGLLAVADVLNALSDLLDKAIAEIQHSIENFFLDDLTGLKSEVDKFISKVRDEGGAGDQTG
jgi:hypothetical protein